MAERFTIVGLARARATWFSEVARWSASSLVPAEFTKCVSAAEVRARLDSLGAVSAALLDAGAPGVDRDLIAAARDAGAAVIVVDDGRAPRDWVALGASAVLPHTFDADLLVAQLHASAAPAVDRSTAERRPPDATPTFAAPLVAVCGVPGAGASTVAMAIAQGLAGRADGRGSVLLADFAHDGVLGTYHAAPDVVPGLQEVVEAHRGGRPDRTAIRAATFEVESRGYSLLLGLRRPRDWTALPTRAADATLASLRGAFRWVVADLTAELDGEPETGSMDLEERNHLARSSVRGAACVLAVGAPGVRGVRGLVRLLDALADVGVAAARVVPVVNQAPRSALARAELARTIASLTAHGGSDASPVHLPPRRALELAHRTVDRLPAQLVAPVLAATVATVDRSGAAPEVAGPVPLHRVAS